METKNHKSGGIMKYVLPILMCLCSCSYINTRLGLQDDNPIEELAEFAVKTQTGLDLDFTPSTPEK